MNLLEKRLLFGAILFIAVMLAVLLILNGIAFHKELRQEDLKPLRNDRIETMNWISA